MDRMDVNSPDRFEDQTATAHRLLELGLSADAAAPKAGLFAQCAALLPEASAGAAGLRAFFVPGRIEFLGKHTDYAGGRSLLLAAERGFCAVAAPRADTLVRIRPLHGNGAVEFTLEPSLQPTPGHWSNYAMTAARRIARNFGNGPALRGADIAFGSDLPPAAGMSSSSALLTCIFLILSRINALEDRPEYQREITSGEALAGYLGTVENGQSFGPLAGDRGVGTFGGSEDHTAILCSTPRQISQYAFCPVRLERRVSLPPGCVLAVASSGVTAEKTGGAREGFNRISRVMTTIVAALNAIAESRHPHLAAVIQANPNRIDEMRHDLLATTSLEFPGEVLAARFDQFFEESERLIPDAVDALSQNNHAALGPLVDRSQFLAERVLANQTDETIFLARSARAAGAYAASAFGAGFGGSVWALIPTPAAAFLEEWRSSYQSRFPDRAGSSAFFLTTPGPAAAEL